MLAAMVVLRQKVLKLRWPKYHKTFAKKQFLDQKLMIQSFIYAVYLLISDFLVQSLKANKN